jgi:hypothetical protein
MTISSKKKQDDRNYTMRKKAGNNVYADHVLDMVEKEKDLGVTVDCNLSFEHHIMEKVSKANQMMGLIRRSFVYLDTENFRRLYKAIVRPHLEYANSVWVPRRKKDIITLENVQRRATKLVPGLRNLTYQERLKKLNIPTLVYRRLRGDMIEMYKMISGAYDEQVMPPVDTQAEEASYNTRGHRYKLPRNHNKTRLRQHYFKERIVGPWNSLPDKVVEAPSTKSFEKRLDKHWINQDLVFNYEAALKLCHIANYENKSDDDLDTQE